MITVFFLASAVALSSCFKEPEFSFTPSIEFEGYTKDILLDKFLGANKDSIVISVKFQDGDGDLGLGEEDKAIAQQNDDFNYIIQPYRMKNGTFEAFDPLVPLSGYFPQLKLDEKPGPLEGTLSYTIEFFHSFSPKNDTLRFDVQIKDRSGNLSNVAETEAIIVNDI
ncbi:hypothetical protein [Jiulongibacter sp. NS-SX5]|uniref:hypothetical protein n=1 Tax=Jiulongibacter sp. NS-SX5 TaxID=3463854 RepID=UPI004058D6A7